MRSKTSYDFFFDDFTWVLIHCQLADKPYSQQNFEEKKLSMKSKMNLNPTYE